MDAPHVSYGFLERFYDEDAKTTRIVKRRYETWRVDGEKVGRWDYVPAGHPETDASDVPFSGVRIR